MHLLHIMVYEANASWLWRWLNFFLCFIQAMLYWSYEKEPTSGCVHLTSPQTHYKMSQMCTSSLWNHVNRPFQSFLRRVGNIGSIYIISSWVCVSGWFIGSLRHFKSSCKENSPVFILICAVPHTSHGLITCLFIHIYKLVSSLNLAQESTSVSFLSSHIFITQSPHEEGQTHQK